MTATKEKTGMVIRQHRSFHIVRVDNRDYLCSISSKLWKSLEYPEADAGSRRKSVARVKDLAGHTDPVVVGDLVTVELLDEEEGVIRKVFERRTKFSRKASGKTDREQVMVANVDQIVAVFAADQPKLDRRMLDSFLAAAEAQDIPATIVFNKIDLIKDSTTIASIRAPYEIAGYPTLTTSAADGTGIESLRESLKGKLSVLMGPSGVGKTSLLNSLENGLGLRVREVSARSGRGRHTTTHLEIFVLSGGGSIVDTPGIQRLQLWGVEAERLPYLVPEMAPYIDQCRFANCAHLGEAGCAVGEAVAAGLIDTGRFASYQDMRRSLVKPPRRR